MAIIDSALKPFEELAHNFARKELAPNRETNDRYPFGPLFEDVLDKALGVGFFSLMLPEELGGVEQADKTRVLSSILDTLSQVDASLAGVLLTHAMALEILVQAGCKELIEKTAAETVVTNKAVIACPSFSNPSETGHLPRAQKEADGYVLTGPVEYVVLGGFSSRAVVPAIIAAQEQYSFFCIDLADSRLTKSGPVLSLGLRACPAVDLELRAVPGALVGEEGSGEDYFRRSSACLHVAAAAMASGIMKGSFDEALSYTRERSQGGRELIGWSEVKSMLANMAVNVQVAHMTTAAAAEAVDNNEPDCSLSAQAAAVHVQKLACDSTTDGIQLLGGYGYMKDYGQEKRFRDAKQVQCLLGRAPLKRLRYLESLINR